MCLTQESNKVYCYDCGVVYWKGYKECPRCIRTIELQYSFEYDGEQYDLFSDGSWRKEVHHQSN